MRKDKVFFHFLDENTSIDYRIPVSCTEEEWDEWFESDIERVDSFIGNLEQVAVHDVCGLEEEDGTILVGFTSYEADEASKLSEILNKWKEKLVELGWTKDEEAFIQVKQVE